MPAPPTPSDRLPLILVADDVPENRQLFTLYLRGSFEVVTASTAEEALEVLRQRPFEAALLDINYGGGMDGFDAIRAIRADSQLAYLPAAALTAHVAPEDRDQCLAAGFDAFLAKPVRRAEMKEALASLLALRTSASKAA
ncbi:response regulator [Rubricoccus marinus]|uniref:response regulator n=1 Tax=Rubricoccus marinus TaxID=716817 RepID=UPI0015C672FC|nr:response regulator [Rubricoccus marinus]